MLISNRAFKQPKSSLSDSLYYFFRCWRAKIKMSQISEILNKEILEIFFFRKRDTLQTPPPLCPHAEHNPLLPPHSAKQSLSVGTYHSAMFIHFHSSKKATLPECETVKFGPIISSMVFFLYFFPLMRILPSLFLYLISLDDI